MFYPKIKGITGKSTKISTFGGYVKNSYVPENAFCDMENLTSERFPLLSVRSPRGRWNGIKTVNGEKTYTDKVSFSGKDITAVCGINGKMCICTTDEIIFDGKTVDGAVLDPLVKKRSAVPFGLNVFIVPDGIYLVYTDDGYTAKKCTVPNMDMAVEHNNRIWGCRFGKNGSGEYINEIYASKLGDPTVWDSFQGISTDSFTASLGCGGEFTGAASSTDGVIFFKDEYIIRVSGDTPSEFTVLSFPARGVEKGAYKSVVNLNEKIFYKSRSGIMVYDGALPYSISEDMGNTYFFDAVSGGIGGKYYIAMTDENSNRGIFVYDTKTGLWHREDDIYPTEFMLTSGGCLLFVKCTDNSDASKKYGFFVYDNAKCRERPDIFGSSEEYEGCEYFSEENVNWFCESGKMGESVNPGRQYLRRISMTLSLEKGATVSLYILPDKESEWKRLCYIDTPVNGVFTVPVVSPVCHSFKLRFEGKGGFTLFSLVRHCETSNGVRCDG